jgi:hypothetical protein
MVCLSADVGIGRIGENLFRKDGKLLVSKVTSVDGQGSKGNILKAFDLIGGFSKVVEKAMKFC